MPATMEKMATAVPQDGGGGHAGAAMAPPPHAVPEVSEAGVLPRMVKELARAPHGATRFKIQCMNYPGQAGGPKYVLAKDQAGAVECYLKSTGLGAHVANLKKNNPKARDEIPEPELSITPLAD